MELNNWIIERLAHEPGMTAMGLAVLYRGGEPTKGHYHPISHAVAKLRRAGIIEDVAERCPKCGCAQTRGHRNVPLYLTKKGYAEAAALALPEAA